MSDKDKKDIKSTPKSQDKAELNEKDLDNVVGGRDAKGPVVTGTPPALNP